MKGNSEREREKREEGRETRERRQRRGGEGGSGTERERDVWPTLGVRDNLHGLEPLRATPLYKMCVVNKLIKCTGER